MRIQSKKVLYVFVLFELIHEEHLTTCFIKCANLYVRYLYCMEIIEMNTFEILFFME